MANGPPQMAQLRSSDVRGFGKFADLVKVTVVKLQAEGRKGELGEGTLHSLLFKKLAENQGTVIGFKNRAVNNPSQV